MSKDISTQYTKMENKQNGRRGYGFWKEEKDRLKEVLTENNIEFICYESSGYYSHEFIVRKSNRKWNDLYKIVNSVFPVKYSFKNTEIKMINGKPTEYM